MDFIATREPVPGLATVAYDQIGLDHPNNGDITVFVEPHWQTATAGTSCPGTTATRPPSTRCCS